MIDSDFFVGCKQWQKKSNDVLDVIINRACKIEPTEPTHTITNALAILAKEFGDTIPITPETMEEYRKNQSVFHLQVDIDFEKYEIRINREEVEAKE